MPPPLRTALITGASAGIGRELARLLVTDRGMTVLATARRADRLESLAAELPPGRLIPYPGDLADPAFRLALWTRAEEMLGGVDLLVNNAGIGHYATVADSVPALNDGIIAINLNALVDLSRLAAASMIPRGHGQICQVSSVLGLFGLPGSAVYVATKHAVHGFVRSMRHELRGTGVRVWAACPGRTRSEFFTNALGLQPDATVPKPVAEDTVFVARGILRGLDSRATFVYPTLSAKTVAFAATWLPWALDAFVARWGMRHLARELELAAKPNPTASTANPSAP